MIRRMLAFRDCTARPYDANDEHHRGKYKTLSNSIAAFDETGRLSRVLTTLLLLQAGYAYVPFPVLPIRVLCRALRKTRFRSTDNTNYDACLAGRFRLLPDDTVLEALREDFQHMVDAGMFIGDPPAFDAIVERLRALEAVINQQPRDPISSRGLGRFQGAFRQLGPCPPGDGPRHPPLRQGSCDAVCLATSETDWRPPRFVAPPCPRPPVRVTHLLTPVAWCVTR